MFVKTLNDIIFRLQNKQYQNEEHVRFSLIARILKNAGWDIWDASIVFCEYPTKTGKKIDIAIRKEEGKEALALVIEVKKFGELSKKNTLEAAEKQLQTYCQDLDIFCPQFALLSDGQIWRFYILIAGKINLFLKIDLLDKKIDIDKISEYFKLFISKESLNFDTKAVIKATELLDKKFVKKWLNDNFVNAENAAQNQLNKLSANKISEIVNKFRHLGNNEPTIIYLITNFFVNKSPKTIDEKCVFNFVIHKFNNNAKMPKKVVDSPAVISPQLPDLPAKNGLVIGTNNIYFGDKFKGKDNYIFGFVKKENDNKWILQKGAKCSLKPSNEKNFEEHASKSYKMWKDVMLDEKFPNFCKKINDETYELLQNLEFSSPSGVACFITTSSVSGYEFFNITRS